MTTPIILSPHQIKIGDFITVLEWTSHQDNSYRGNVLEVSAVNLPFVVCKRHTGGWGSEKPLTLKTDQVQLTSLSKEFVDAALGRKTEEKPQKPDRTIIKLNVYAYNERAACVHLPVAIWSSFYSAYGDIYSRWNWEDVRPATHDEIKAHLIAEAEKRGIRVGAIVRLTDRKVDIDYEVRELVLVTLPVPYMTYSSAVDVYAGEINRPFLMARGCWQYPVDKVEVAVLSITVDGVVYTPKFCEGYVEFGCARIANETFVGAFELIKRSCDLSSNMGKNNRCIASIRIGKGDFSPELIAGIVAEIEKRAKEVDEDYEFYVHSSGMAFGEHDDPCYICWNRKTNKPTEVYRDKSHSPTWHQPSPYWTKLPNRAAAEALIRKTS